MRNAWPHDGIPIESTNFVVHSDAARVEARHEVATVAEDVWAELVDELSIEPGMLRYPEGQDKIEIYAYHDCGLYAFEWGVRGLSVGGEGVFQSMPPQWRSTRSRWCSNRLKPCPQRFTFLTSRFNPSVGPFEAPVA